MRKITTLSISSRNSLFLFFLIHDFTNRNTTFLVWNCLHLARMLKDQGGVPAYGNLPDEWKAGCKAGFDSPEHKR